MPPPTQPTIYHIMHVDRLPSVVADGGLRCDAEMANRPDSGTVVGMSDIKRRRLTELTLTSHPGLAVRAVLLLSAVGDAVPAAAGEHPSVTYRGGEDLIVHLEADLHATVRWAEDIGHRWAFTLSNAGARYFEDRADLRDLGDINWDAVAARVWSGRDVPASIKDGKQAEFLVERRFPWDLVRRIGVRSRETAQRVSDALAGQAHRPPVVIREDWYCGG